MDIVRSDLKKKKRRRQITIGIASAGVLAVIAFILFSMDPAAPSVDRSSVWIGEVKKGPLQVNVRGIGTLVPEDLRDCSVEEFLERLPSSDGLMQDMLDSAREAGQVLRYVGTLDADGRATVGIRRLAIDHAFAHLALTDNIVRFVTARYAENPLIVQGPGAGPAVTAGGVFGDLLRLAAYLGARI